MCGWCRRGRTSKMFHIELHTSPRAWLWFKLGNHIDILLEPKFKDWRWFERCNGGWYWKLGPLELNWMEN